MKKLLLAILALGLCTQLTWSQTKISQLPAGTTPTGTEIFPAVQGGNTVGLTLDQVNTFMIALSNIWSAPQTFTPSVGAVAITANPLSQGNGLRINSATGTLQGIDLAVIRSGTTAGTVEAGADIVLNDSLNNTWTVLQQAGGQSELYQFGNGTWTREWYTGPTNGFVVGAASGGDKGAGTVNATQLYVNGVAVGTGAGTVTSVGLSLPTSLFTITGSPVTGSGTLTGSFVSQTQNLVLASPNGASGVPTMRALVAFDLPAINLTLTGNGGVLGNGPTGECLTGEGIGLAPAWNTCPTPAINLTAAGTNGGVVENGSSGQCLTSGGNSSPPVWATCAASAATGTATLTYVSGCNTGSWAPSITYTVSGNTATVRVAAATCTATGGSLLASGLPAAIEPTHQSDIPCVVETNSGTVTGLCLVGISGELDDLEITVGTSAFTGTSGSVLGETLTYPLN